MGLGRSTARTARVPSPPVLPDARRATRDARRAPAVINHARTFSFYENTQHIDARVHVLSITFSAASACSSRTASTPAFSARNSSRSVDTPSLSPNFSPPDASPPPSRDRRALPDRCSPLARKNHTTRGRFPTPSPWRRPPRTRTTNRPSTGRALERIPRAPSTASPLTVHLFPRVSFARPPRVATCGRTNEVLLVLSKKRRKTDDSSRDRRRVVAGGTRDSLRIHDSYQKVHHFPTVSPYITRTSTMKTKADAPWPAATHPDPIHPDDDASVSTSHARAHIDDHGRRTHVHHDQVRLSLRNTRNRDDASRSSVPSIDRSIDRSTGHSFIIHSMRMMGRGVDRMNARVNE